jgi:hypothetical protein
MTPFDITFGKGGTSGGAVQWADRPITMTV